MSRLSIIIPVYNERATIQEIIRRVEAVDFGESEKEIIIVDDGSTDGTRDILNGEIARRHRVVLHELNKGKGAAIRTGLAAATGDYFVVQDADLEYDPKDIARMLTTLKKGGHDIVYGSRVMGRRHKEYSSFVFHVGGNLVTWWANALFHAGITDEATCYKMFTRNVLNSVTLECTGFEFCPELTGKAINAGFRIVEIPISYAPRDVSEGKKIKMSDGFTALWTLLKVKLWNRL